MANHYHFLLHTRPCCCIDASRQRRLQPDLQTYNPRHDKVGHSSKDASKQSWLTAMPICRTVPLRICNPVPARIVCKPHAWESSRHRTHIDQAPVLEWLDTSGLHGYLLGRAATRAAERRRAAARYARLVTSVPDARSALHRIACTIWRNVVHEQE